MNSDSNAKTEIAAGPFRDNLPNDLTFSGDAVQMLLLKEYGSMFVARGVAVATKIVFRDEADVAEFQAGMSISGETIGGHAMELQTAAMEDLRRAIAEAESAGLSISPRGPDSARRGYDETVGLWNSRVEPALKHWVDQGRMTIEQAAAIAAMAPFEQVAEVLKLEEQGIYFAKDLSKSIIYSVAPPGTSQHLSMLAFDVVEFNNEKVRSILAKHKWHQTVVSDLPHFTYLGVVESELRGLGLKQVMSGGRVFWVPDI